MALQMIFLHIQILQILVICLCIELVAGHKPQDQLFQSGLNPVANPLRVAPVNIDRDLLHVVLAVSYAQEPDQIVSSNVAGFIYVTDIDLQRRKITYLSPTAGELPSKYLVMGTLTWLET
ncbi:hypothetical protein OIU77_001833 [Salix suchowensis]|uniref:Clp1 C-terminal domain-containing protein n=1 Tax=Salix suchowensis TaxID=1278906 RepID=A0ABQ9B2Q9_9ROSI|nr:hypothetical protein OIU77_001833 [Salix suchowensis]